MGNTEDAVARSSTLTVVLTIQKISVVAQVHVPFSTHLKIKAGYFYLLVP
jgi:hypothetical protein